MAWSASLAKRSMRRAQQWAHRAGTLIGTGREDVIPSTKQGEEEEGEGEEEEEEEGGIRKERRERKPGRRCVHPPHPVIKVRIRVKNVVRSRPNFGCRRC